MNLYPTTRTPRRLDLARRFLAATHASLLAAATVTLLIAGCGGGGDSQTDDLESQPSSMRAKPERAVSADAQISPTVEQLEQQR